MVRKVMLALLDPWLYRHPFEGTSARRYARDERPAFGDLDARLCDRWARDLAAARVLLDVGAGPGTFGAEVRTRRAELAVIAVEPSRAFAAELPAGGVRARAEALPLADVSIDVAVSISSIRHVADRRAALAELRRVVRPGGALLIAELDPAAERHRIRNHADRLGSALLRAAFGPLVVRTAPAAETIADLARDAGWARIELEDDPVQPVYLMRLT
jgi:ubiquinone/menaquinone biosynthesis C-methylase UbiE